MGPRTAGPFVRHLLHPAHRGWDRFFAVTGARRIDVDYEDLAAAYADTVRSVLRRIVGAEGDVPISPPETHKLADERSGELLQRFRADRRAAEATRTA